MLGEITSLENGPVRNVAVSIKSDLLESEIATPKGPIHPDEVTGIILEKRKKLFRTAFHLGLKTKSSEIDFYRSRSSFDIALLLDELDAIIGHRPRTLINIEFKAP